MMVGFVGGGNMAEALIKGIMNIPSMRPSKTAQTVIVSEPREDRRRYLEQTYHVRATHSNGEVAALSSLIILAVKPQDIAVVLDEIAPLVNDEKTVVSIAAGVTLSYLQSRLATGRLIRVMPNTPALVQEGMSVLSLCSCLPDDVVGPVRDIFMSIGKVITLPETHMNAVTALSGSGPGFIAFFLECLVDGGVHLGLSRETASELAIQTAIGTTRLLETGMPPAQVRAIVTSPGGTTAAGLASFENSGFKEVVAKALGAARDKADDLGHRG